MNAPKLHLRYEALWACIADTVLRLFAYIMPKKAFFLVARNPSRHPSTFPFTSRHSPPAAVRLPSLPPLVTL